MERYLRKNVWTLVRIAVYLCTIFLLPVLTTAEAADVPAVKIAVYNNSNFAYQDKQSIWRGIDIECMINVAQHAGFKPVFIDSAADPDFLGNLDRGNYDIVADVGKNREREQKYLFSDLVLGSAYATLAVRTHDERWEYGNIEQISGMKIGILATYTINNLFRSWCRERRLTPMIKEYRDVHTLAAALETGAIDAEIYTAMYETEGNAKFRSILKFLPQDYYYAFRKNDTELKNKFDTAMLQILQANPYYLSDLKKKYAEQFPENTLFTGSETKYISEHGLVKVSMIKDNAPFYVHETGQEPEGILPEYFKVLQEKTGLQFKFQDYATYEEAAAAVKDGTADMMGAFMGGMIAANRYDMALTDNFLAGNNMLLTRTNFTAGIKTIGIVHSSLDPAGREIGPALAGAHIQEYENVSKCFQALEQSKVDAIILCTPASTWILNQNNSTNYSFKPLPGFNAEMCGALRPGNKELISILNKGVMATTNSTDSIITNATRSENNWRTFIARLSPAVIVLVTGVLLVLVLGLIWALFMLRRRDQERTAVLEAQAETERERLQIEALRKNAEERNKFFSNISHDMRTPLNAIIGFSDLASKKAVSPQVADYLEKIKLSGHLLLHLINDTLTLSKVSNGKLELHPEPVSTDDITRTVTASLMPDAAAKGVAFVVDDAGLKPRTVMADRLNLEKILLNLLSNAVKFTPSGKRVWFIVSDADVSAPDSDIIITIKDEGIGMSPAYLQHLYEPFSQEKREGYENMGTGLGLSIVKHLVELMGGTISVQSAVNTGTTFTVRLHLPVAVSVATVAPATAGIKLEVLQGKKILLCEDNKMNAEITILLLQDKKMQVDWVPNGQEGVTRFAVSPLGEYAAILMDLRMPVLNGYEATAAIRKLERKDATGIPIIAMTADAFADDVQKCLEAGMNGHIAKPIEPSQLYKTLAQALQ